MGTVAVLVLPLLGTFWGQDDHFPVRSVSYVLDEKLTDGRVNAARLELQFADGVVAEIGVSPASVGLRRAEVEGQQDRFEARPRLLSHLAETYERLHPDLPPVVAVRLFDVVIRLRGGRPHGTPR